MGISNVKIGGKRARKVKGKWTTKKKKKKSSRKKKVHKFVAKQPAVTKKSKVAPVIKLKKRKFGEGDPSKFKGVEKFVAKAVYGKEMGKDLTPEEKDKLAKKRRIKAGIFAGTTALTWGLSAGIGGGGAIGAGAKAVSTASKASKASKLVKLSRPLKDIGKQINVNQIGKSAGLTKSQTAALAKQIGRERINVLARHAVNPKSTSLTKSIIKGVGGSAALVGVIGSYPFAGFIKEESLQTLGFATRTAQNMGDVEGMETAIKEQEEILNPDAMDKLISVIPYANVVKQLKDFYKSASAKLEQDKKFLEQKRNEEPEEDKWAKIYEEQEARREEQRASDEEYWEGIKESQEKAREEGREEDAQYWNDVRERNEEAKKLADQEDLEEMEWKAEYYDLIRQGKYEEAQALLESKLKGGE